MKNIFQKDLSTVNRQLSTCILFFFFILGNLAQAQPDARLDSLENAIKHAEGTKKADLMIGSVKYQWEKLRALENEPFVNAVRAAYQYSKEIHYTKGMAESAKYLVHAFSGIKERDSVRHYLSESLKLYIELKDSLNIAGLYCLYAGSERGDGNYVQALSYVQKSLDIGIALNNVTTQISALEYFGEIYKLKGDFSKEEESYLKLLDINTINNFNSSRVLIFLARFHINHGNYEQGINYSMKADSAIGELENADMLEYHDKTFMQGKMKGMVARAYRLWGYYDSALVWYRRAIETMESASFHSNVDIPNQWEGLGAVYTQQGMYDSARFYLEKSAYSREDVRDFLGAGESFDALGYMCWLLGDQEGAVNYYRTAIEMKSKVGTVEASWRITTFKESLSLSYLRLGQAYASWGLTESALREFDKSQELYRDIGYRKGEAEVLIEFGKLNNGNLQAEKNLKDAFRIFVEIDYRPGQADAISSLGDLYYSRGEFEKSLEYYYQAENILLHAENPILLADAWMKTGKTLSHMKKYNQAEKYLVRALNQAKNYNLFQQIMKAQKALSDLYRLIDKKSLALENFLGYLVMRDSVNRQKTYYMLADLQSRNESDMNLRQIELLEKEEEVKNLKLSRSNAFLVGSFGLFLLLILLSVSILRTARLKDAQREAMLQQKLFRSRMSPDFITYSLGNVKKLVTESKITEASDYITWFSRLMQSMLEGSRQELIVFSKGITMLRSYFELMKLSQAGSFDYEINIDPGIDVDEMMVPSFLEEVIAPGYKAEPGHRYIKLAFTGKEKKISINIESKGYIATSAGLSDQDLDSLKMIRARLSGMEKRYQVRLGFEIIDLFDEEGRLDGKRLDFEVPAVFD